MVNKHKRVPRKTKKNCNVKHGIIIYDLQSCPKGVQFEQVIDIQYSTGIVIWESSNGGKEPKLMGRRFRRFGVKDISKLK